MVKKRTSAKKSPLKTRSSAPVIKTSKRVMSRSSEFTITPAVGKPVLITDVALRDGHQSLLATRMRTEDMLPIAQKLDAIGYWSLEVWAAPRSTPVCAS
ncbi:MAG: hypothetical protein QM706_01500 [Nitrospira sp.]